MNDEQHAKLRIGQSADPDDAFMAWALDCGEVTVPGFDAEVCFSDIQTLNEWALEGRLEVTALSAGAYPRVADRYRLLRCGASFGADYGPLVVGRQPPQRSGPGAVEGLRIAVPGLLTTAYLLLRSYAGDSFEAVTMGFDRIIEAIVEETVDAGLIIHEGQLTYAEHGLHAIFEPARIWHEAQQLPLPLGIVVVRRDLGNEGCRAVASAFRASIDAALAQSGRALAFAARHARGLDERQLQTFIDQYVDDATLDMGEVGISALQALYSGAARQGLLDSEPPLDLVG